MARLGRVPMCVRVSVCSCQCVEAIEPKYATFSIKKICVLSTCLQWHWQMQPSGSTTTERKPIH